MLHGSYKKFLKIFKNIQEHFVVETALFKNIPLATRHGN